MEENIITIGDVAQMAVNMEIKGMNFYNWAAKQFDNKLVKDIFMKLSEDEKEHVKIFRQLLSFPVADQQLKPNASRFFLMIGQKGDIFPEHGEITENVGSPVEALSIGIQAEKDAILLYQELYNEAESQEVKKLISKLLEEEKIHLLELRDYMDELQEISH